MKTVKSRFRFIKNDGSTMECHYQAQGFTKDDAIGKTWEQMGEDNFNRKIILTTKTIELLSVEEIQMPSTTKD